MNSLRTNTDRMFQRLLTLELLEDRVTPATITVINTNDDGVGDTLTLEGDLRFAITQAELLPGDDTIVFNIPGPGPHTITVRSDLPTLRNLQGGRTIIDGTTQPGYAGTPIVAIDGSQPTEPTFVGLNIQSSNNEIRGLAIQNFPSAGISIGGDLGVPGAGNTIEGNFIGTDFSGISAAANGVGILIGGDPTVVLNNIIGGTGPNEGNLISGNTSGGILVIDSDINQILGNFIGTDITGTKALSNNGPGISLVNFTSGSAVGDGTSAGANVIAFNTGPGVAIGHDGSDVAVGNTVSGNSIFANKGPGIDLGSDGISPNVAPPAPNTSPNDRQNFPVLTSASGTTVTGFLNSLPATTFRVELFANSPTGQARQGASFLGFVDVTTDGTGKGTFTASVSPIPAGSVVTATATHSSTGSTSEFSPGPPAQLIALSGTPQSTLVNTPFTDALSVEVRDGFNEPLVSLTGGIPVTFTAPASGASGTFSASPTQLTDSNGQVAISFTANTVAGSYFVGVNSGDANNASAFDLTNIPDSVSTLEVTGFPSPVFQGDQQTFTVTARDQFGNVDTNYGGTLSFTSSDPAAVLPPDFTFTSGDAGTATFTATLNTLGTQSITAIDISDGTLSGSQTDILVQERPVATTIQVMGFPSPVFAGDQGSFTVTVLDQFGAVFTDYTGTVTFTSSDPAAQLPPDTTFLATDNGTRTFNATLNTVGTQSITASDTSDPLLTGTQAGIVVNAVSPPVPPPPPPAPLSRSVTPLVSVSGLDDGSVQFMAPDEVGNLVPSSPPVVPFSASGGSTTFGGGDFGDALGVVRSTSGDFDGDGQLDFVHVQGPNSASQVRIVTSTGIDVTFQPFESSFIGGLFIAAGDVDGDGLWEFFISPDEGGGGRVTGYRLVNGQPVAFANFFGIEDLSFRGGARIAVGDVNGDGILDLVVAAGFSGGPRIAIFDGRDITAAGFDRAPVKLVGDFFAFESTLRNGAFVDLGDANEDGAADLYLGGGPGGAPRVLILSGLAVLDDPLSAVNTPLANFFSGDPARRGGVRIAAADLDGDDRADLVTGSGVRISVDNLQDLNGDGFLDVPDLNSVPPAEVITYLGINLLAPNGIEPVRQQSFQPFGNQGLAGVFVG